MSKAKFAMYWAAACGGCEIAVLEIKEKILEVAEHFDIVFWPVATDFKYKDVEGYEDGSIDVACSTAPCATPRTSTSPSCCGGRARCMVAFGACATMGGIPGLANVSTRAGDQGPRLHAGALARQPRQGLPAGAAHGA